MRASTPPIEVSSTPRTTQTLGEDPQAEISRTIASNPALQHFNQGTSGQPWIDGAPFLKSVERFGYSFLDSTALRELSLITEPHGGKVVSVFTGLGYPEAQMVAKGMDVIGFDKDVPAKRWLLDTHEGPKGLSWKRFADRALFMSFPESPVESKSVACDVVDKYLAAGGSTVVIITEARPTQHAIKCEAALLRKLEQGELIAEVALPKWPAITIFTGYGHVHSTFEPVLKAYSFARKSS
jgi:hypothetical protein